MKFYTLERNQTLYHGASRLYQIICFIRTNQKAWQRYLDTSPFYIVDDEKELPSDFISEFRKYYKIREKRYAPSPISNEVLFILTVLLLQQFKIDDLSVNRVWNVLLPDTLDATELTNFAYDVESKAHNLLDLTSSSSFHIPVRFFSDNFKRAQHYGDKMFAYRSKSDISLLDFRSSETRKELSQNVFNSKESFSLELIRYHTMHTNVKIFRLNLMNIIYSLMGSKFFDFLNEFMSPYIPVKDETKYDVTESFITRKHIKQHYLIPIWNENWSTYFRTELISPYGLWKLVNSNIPDFRLSSYETDALLLRVLYDDGRYNGYYNPYNSEIAIFHPERYGKLYYIDGTTIRNDDLHTIDSNTIDPAKDTRFKTIENMEVNINECPITKFITG